MKKTITLVLAMFLCGCTTVPQQPKASDIQKVPMPAEPDWVATKLDKDTPLGEVTLNYKAFRKQAFGYIRELQTALKPYTTEQPVEKQK